MSSAAMTSPEAVPPPPFDPWALVREWGGLVLIPMLGWLAAQWRAWRTWKARRTELFETMAEAVTLYLDAERFEQQYGQDTRAFEDYLDGEALDQWRENGAEGLTPRQQYEKLQDRKRELRKRHWHARGFPDAPPEPEARAEHAARVQVMRELRTTKRWQLQELAEKKAAAAKQTDDTKAPPAPPIPPDGGPVA